MNGNTEASLQSLVQETNIKLDHFLTSCALIFIFLWTMQQWNTARLQCTQPHQSAHISASPCTISTSVLDNRIGLKLDGTQRRSWTLPWAPTLNFLWDRKHFHEHPELKPAAGIFMPFWIQQLHNRLLSHLVTNKNRFLTFDVSRSDMQHFSHVKLVGTWPAFLFFVMQSLHTMSPRGEEVPGGDRLWVI